MPAQKRKAEKSEEEVSLPKPGKSGSKKSKITKDNSEDTPETEIQDENRKEMNAALRILCWNVNGVRAWLKKPSTMSYVKAAAPDIICFQEVKCSREDLPAELLKGLPGSYQVHWLTGDKAGYAGVGMLTKEKPLKVTYGLGNSEHDNEGRFITAEFEKFFMVNAYVPNSGRGLPRLDYRCKKWEPAMRDYLAKLDSSKPVIVCGDLNVAHREIDLANPKSNVKNAGFTPQERAEFEKLLKSGFVDAFRHFYPEKKGAYTFWSARGGARENNVGWRLDYFLVSERFTSNLVDSVIGGNAVLGSDHCPILLYANP